MALKQVEIRIVIGAGEDNNRCSRRRSRILVLEVREVVNLFLYEEMYLEIKASVP